MIHFKTDVTWVGWENHSNWQKLKTSYSNSTSRSNAHDRQHSPLICPMIGNKNDITTTWFYWCFCGTDITFPCVFTQQGVCSGNNKTKVAFPRVAGKTGRHSPLCRDGRFWLQSGSDCPKLVKSGAFSDQISVHWAPGRQMYWNLIWKIPGFVPFGANLTRFGAKPTIPANQYHVFLFSLQTW